MNVKGVFQRALELCGRDEYELVDDARLRSRELGIAKAVYDDLYFEAKRQGAGWINNNPYLPPKSTSDEVKLCDDIVSDCFVYGVAMWIAEGESDNDDQRFFSEIYERKRGHYCAPDGRMIKDVLP